MVCKKSEWRKRKMNCEVERWGETDPRDLEQTISLSLFPGEGHKASVLVYSSFNSFTSIYCVSTMSGTALVIEVEDSWPKKIFLK